jgi:hypothetical protein
MYLVVNVLILSLLLKSFLCIGRIPKNEEMQEYVLDVAVSNIN